MGDVNKSAVHKLEGISVEPCDLAGAQATDQPVQ